MASHENTVKKIFLACRAASLEKTKTKYFSAVQAYSLSIVPGKIHQCCCQRKGALLTHLWTYYVWKSLTLVVCNLYGQSGRINAYKIKLNNPFSILVDNQHKLQEWESFCIKQQINPLEPSQNWKNKKHDASTGLCVTHINADPPSPK